MTIDLSGILGFFLDIWQSCISFAESVLPQSPVSGWMTYFEALPYIGWINWFIPVGTCLTIGAGWIACIGAYYLLSAILRWAKMVA